MDRFVEANGLRQRCRVEGAGPDLVLVHGVGGRLEAWDGVVAALGGRYRTLRYDLRGHGETCKPPGAYTLDDFVADLAALMQAQGFSRAHLAGFSLGGLVAQGFALAHADRLHRLALISTVAGRTEAERARVKARLDQVAKGIPGAHFGTSVSRWFTEPFQLAHPEVIALHKARNRANDPAAYASAYRVLAESDLADRLHAITSPTLVMTGAEDEGSNPRMARLIQSRIAGAELVILPGLRHSILIEAPDRVAGYLDGFFAAGASG